MSIEIWDPHFHIWDVSENTTSGHDATQLFAPNNNPVYSWKEYERDIGQAGERYSHKGGAFIEAVSVCHIDQSGPIFSDACLAESRWASSQLNQSDKKYVLVSTAPLEDPGIGSILATLTDDPRVCGIRQIINFEPSWPRNEKLGNLLENHQWRMGFAELANYSLSYDLQLNPNQFKMAADLISKHPDTPIIIGHLGSPTQTDLKEQAQQYWDGLRALAEHERAFIKISMLSYIDENWDQNSLIKDTVLRVIDIFGVDRCFFASNFPAEYGIAANWRDAGRLFKALEQLVEGQYGSEELQKLFSSTAQSVYLPQAS